MDLQLYYYYIIRRAMATVNVPTVFEPSGKSRTDGQRPDGTVLIPSSMGRELIWDTTYVDLLAPSHLLNMIERADSADVLTDRPRLRLFIYTIRSRNSWPVGIQCS